MPSRPRATFQTGRNIAESWKEGTFGQNLFFKTQAAIKAVNGCYWFCLSST